MQKNFWASIFWKVFSCACFAGINGIVRYLSGGSALAISQKLPIYTIMFWQHLFGAICLTVFMAPKLNKETILKNNLWTHLLRVGIAALAIAIWNQSLRFIPMTQVVALSFIAPVLTVMGSVFFLKEDFNFYRKIAVALGLLGSFMITRPDLTIGSPTEYGWYVLLPIGASLIFASDKLLCRKLLITNTEPMLLAWYLLTLLTPMCFVANSIFGWVTLTLENIGFLVLLGIISALAHYAFSKAYSMAEVTFLLPFGASKIVLSAMVSFAAFGEFPKTWDMAIGVVIMTISTIVLQIKKPAPSWVPNAVPVPRLDS